MGRRASSSLRPALFLDIEGTILVCREEASSSEREFVPGVLEFLKEAQAVFSVFVGGASDASTVRSASVAERLREQGVAIAGICPLGAQAASGCAPRRLDPEPLVRVAAEHGLDLPRSFVIGDHPADAELGRALGGKGVYVLTGHGLRHRSELGAGFIVVPSLPDARHALGLGPKHSRSAVAQRSDVLEAAALLREGGIVAFPTETVYGLGANALDTKAVARVFAVKGRPSFDPLIAHIADVSWVERLASFVPPLALQLMEAFWPGPLTLVLPKTPLVPDVATAGLPTVAIRMPAHEVARALLAEAGIPVCAPSANPFGYVSPTSAEHVRAELGDRVDCILDGGPCPVGVESTIVGFGPEGPHLLRPGGITPEHIEKVLGQPLVERTGEGSVVNKGQVVAPGMLKRHYSPKVPMVLFEGEVPPPPNPRTGLLLQKPREHVGGYAALEVLSEEGDLAEVASNLFAALRRLDALNLDVVFAEMAPEVGLGRAINDRLRRASARERGTPRGS